MTVSLIPPTELAKLTARIQELETTLQRVRDLHAPEAWEDDVDGTSGVGCAGCACPECGDVEAQGPYPCPTIQALEGETR